MNKYLKNKRGLGIGDWGFGVWVLGGGGGGGAAPPHTPHPPHPTPHPQKKKIIYK